MTGILREHGHATASSAVPLDALHCGHQSELQRLSQALYSNSKHLLGQKAADAPHSARAANSDWLNAVSKATGVDIAGDELQNLAIDVFWLLRSDTVDQHAVSMLLGSGISAQHLADLQAARTALAKERQKLQLPDDLPEDVSEARFAQSAETNWPASWEEAMQGLYSQSTVLSQTISHERIVGAQSHQVSVADAEAQWKAYKEAAKVVPTAEPEDIPHVMDGRERTVAKMNLTALERIVCRITGQPPPSKGGDESVLLLTARALLHSDRPDAAAGELVDVLGLSHMDQISHIVTMREVCWTVIAVTLVVTSCARHTGGTILAKEREIRVAGCDKQLKASTGYPPCTGAGCAVPSCDPGSSAGEYHITEGDPEARAQSSKEEEPSCYASEPEWDRPGTGLCIWLGSAAGVWLCSHLLLHFLCYLDENKFIFELFSI